MVTDNKNLIVPKSKKKITEFNTEILYQYCSECINLDTHTHFQVYCTAYTMEEAVHKVRKNTIHSVIVSITNISEDPDNINIVIK